MSVTPMPPAAGKAEEPEKKGGGKKKLILILVAVLAIGGAAYWFVLKPKPEPKPEPGEVVSLEPIQINLEGGHYLKIGVALQLTTTAHEADGSKALDATIELFTGKSMDELTRKESRAKLKNELAKELEHAYHGDVMGVFFTNFVTQ
ncbi:MAG TPA: flagellar basal body-associated FliL family protein [Marmoricola sp.]|nr:flagellar basal body-associated FliL family protein [Marmoricola sp.]